MARYEFAPRFSQEEFRCNCGCGTENPNREFLERLQRARIRAGIPFHVNSGSRCADHNRDVGGVDSSSHLATMVSKSGTDDEEIQSHAADIGARGPRQRGIIIPALLAVGFNRLGIATSFVHVDIDPALPPNVIWLY